MLLPLLWVSLVEGNAGAPVWLFVFFECWELVGQCWLDVCCLHQGPALLLAVLVLLGLCRRCAKGRHYC